MDMHTKPLFGHVGAFFALNTYVPASILTLKSLVLAYFKGTEKI
jgi:hypothetical protein